LHPTLNTSRVSVSERRLWRIRFGSLGCELDEGGFVRADPTLRTSLPGVWVAGNATNPRAQVITAAGEGSTAAIAINADLVREDVHTALHRDTLTVNH
jgi:thioredoxin reductase